MDTSPDYILMCEKAKEIQEQFVADFSAGKLPARGIWFSPKESLRWGDFSLKVSRSNQDLIVMEAGKVYCTGNFVNFVDFEDITSNDSCSLEDPTLVIWLPTQDQFQEMVDLKNYVNEDIVEVLLDWASWIQTQADINWKVFRQYGSGEQLWLAFVMRQKFDKIWNGVEWVKA